MKPLQQFNSMIQFYCSAHSGNSEVTVFENNGRVITRVDNEDWMFSIKVHQTEPKAEVVFINLKDNTHDKATYTVPKWSHLWEYVLAFHWKCMSEVH